MLILDSIELTSHFVNTKQNNYMMPNLFIQLAKHEQLTKSQTLNAATLHSHLAELSGKHKKLETENDQLKADKDVLLEHVSELKDQVGEISPLHQKLYLIIL